MGKFTNPKERRSDDDDVVDVLSEGEMGEEGPSRPYQTKAHVAPAPAPFDMQAFAGALATALSTALAQSGQVTAQAVQDATAEALRSARAKIPENETHPDISVYNPDGERDHPRPGLQCEMFLGQYDEDDQVTPAFAIEGDRCTKQEQILFNQVRPGVFTVRRNDGKTGRVIVQGRRDANGDLQRLVIAVPHGWLGKDQQAQMPSQVSMAEQLIAGAAAR